jgi:hypothetical protein
MRLVVLTLHFNGWYVIRYYYCVLYDICDFIFCSSIAVSDFYLIIVSWFLMSTFIYKFKPCHSPNYMCWWAFTLVWSQFLTKKTGFNLGTFIEVPVPSHESEPSCICGGIDIISVSTISLLDTLIWYVIFFHFLNSNAHLYKWLHYYKTLQFSSIVDMY